MRCIFDPDWGLNSRLSWVGRCKWRNEHAVPCRRPLLLGTISRCVMLIREVSWADRMNLQRKSSP